MAGVPREHTEWMMRCFTGRTTQLVFDDYVSDPAPINDGLDQGNAQSVNLYQYNNAPLARIDPESGIYIDDYHMLAIGNSVRGTNRAVKELVEKEDGVDEWGVTHNSVF
ncbi:hypothetical protein C8R47DRAFT_926571, partial [Mycena vitilis]